jgi:hypothetical protein
MFGSAGIGPAVPRLVQFRRQRRQQRIHRRRIAQVAQRPAQVEQHPVAVRQLHLETWG